VSRNTTKSAPKNEGSIIGPNKLVLISIANPVSYFWVDITSAHCNIPYVLYLIRLAHCILLVTFPIIYDERTRKYKLVFLKLLFYSWVQCVEIKSR
jgi:hypothetical protein